MEKSVEKSPFILLLFLSVACFSVFTRAEENLSFRRILQDPVSEFQVTNSDPGMDPQARVAVFSSGFAVAWQSLWSSNPATSTILLATFDVSGNLLSGPIMLDYEIHF